jgi:hypothetical protein
MPNDYPYSKAYKSTLEKQMEVAIAKVGSPSNWDDTRKMKYTQTMIQKSLCLQPPIEVGFRHCI